MSRNLQGVQKGQQTVGYGSAYRIYTQQKYHYYLSTNNPDGSVTWTRKDASVTYDFAPGSSLSLPSAPGFVDELTYYIAGTLPFYGTGGDPIPAYDGLAYYNAFEQGQDETIFRWSETRFTAQGGEEAPVTKSYDVDATGKAFQTDPVTKGADWLPPGPHDGPSDGEFESVHPFKIQIKTGFLRVVALPTPSTGFYRAWFTGGFANGDQERVLTWKGDGHPCVPEQAEPIPGRPNLSCWMSPLWASADLVTVAKYSYLENYEPQSGQANGLPAIL